MHTERCGAGVPGVCRLTRGAEGHTEEPKGSEHLSAELRVEEAEARGVQSGGREQHGRITRSTGSTRIGRSASQSVESTGEQSVG